MKYLQEGTKLKAIWWPGIEDMRIDVGKHGVVSLTVVNVASQGGYVPWVKVERTEGGGDFYNCAVMDGVAVAEEVQ